MAQKSNRTIKRVPVMVDETLYNAFKQYSVKSGASVSFLIREALNEWAGTVLAARSESLDKTTAKVICIDRPGDIQAIEKALAMAATADSGTTN